uniref:CUB domain-containing protein n=1 Tax=Meloidogyne hapla TaxID=6305 RepID=A0A1I8B2J1_MELHA
MILTILVGEPGHHSSIPSEKTMNDSVAFELEINSTSEFFMDKEPFFDASKNAVCVPKSTPLFEPKTWIITNDEHKDKRLLVFSLLHQNASFKFDGNKIVKGKHPNGPHCELFIQFNRTYYDLLFVPPPKPSTPAPTTTATTEISTTGAKTSLETSKCAPCLCALASTTPMAAVKTTKCPSTETKSNSPVLLILFILVLLGCVITNVIWFYLYKKDKDDKEKQEEEKKAKSIVKSTKGSLYEPDVNTAIQMDVGNTKTASEAGKSTTAGVDVEKAEADAGESKAGEDALNAAATKTLNEV